MDGLSIKSGNLSGNVRIGTDSIKAPTLPNNSTNGVSFADTLMDAVGKVNELQQTADTKMQALATGETTDIADVKIAAEKADIALRLMSSVRNKMIDAYHEIMKMQV